MDIALWAVGAENSGPVEIEGTGTFPQGRRMTLDVLLGKKPSTSLPVAFSTVVDYEARLKFPNGHTILVDGRMPARRKQGVRIGLSIKGDKGNVWATRRGPSHELSGKIIDEIMADDKESAWLSEVAIRLYKGKTPVWGQRAKVIGDIVPTTHMKNFIDCVRDRSEPISDVHTHHRSNSACLLANIAMLVNRELKWDPKGEDFVEDAEASALLSRKQRQPYTIEVQANWRAR